MGYPVTIIGAPDEPFNAYASTDQRYPLGTQLCFHDGRKYRFASTGGSTLAVGDLLQGAAGVSGDRAQTGVANAAGTRSPVVTNTNPTAANLYAEGYLVVDTTPGGGELYVIDNNAAIAAATGTYNLAAGHAIRTATTTSSTTTLVKNPFQKVIQLPITTGTGPIAGVAVKALTSGQFGWVQTAGMAAVLANGTLVIGDTASATRSAAGAVGPRAAATGTEVQVGWVSKRRVTRPVRPTPAKTSAERNSRCK